MYLTDHRQGSQRERQQRKA